MIGTTAVRLGDEQFVSPTTSDAPGTVLVIAFARDGSTDGHHSDADFRRAGGGAGKGFPVVTRDERRACAGIVRRAAP